MDHTSITSSKGFTLIEMLIVVAIIGVVTAVVVTGQHSFERSVILTNTTYDIALSIREAQAYGFSGKSASSVSASTVGKYAYGIDFNLSAPHTYTLFADNGAPQSFAVKCHKSLKIGTTIRPDQKNGDCSFLESSGDTPVKKFTINNGASISKICVSLGTSHPCSSSGQFDISFTRPNSVFVRYGSSEYGNTACIVVSRLGTKRYILVKGYGSGISSLGVVVPYEAGTVSVSDKQISPYCGQ